MAGSIELHMQRDRSDLAARITSFQPGHAAALGAKKRVSVM